MDRIALILLGVASLTAACAEGSQFSNDATIETAFDASSFDASAFDASAFDASAFDASAFDASSIDASTFDANSFDATAQPPSLAAINPAAGETSGGTAVTVAGDHFTADATLTIGGAAASCTIDSGTSISCTTPAGTAGAADVVVTQSSGTDTLAGGFTYTENDVTVDLCALVPPTDLDLLAGVAGQTWRTQVLEAGITDATTGNDPIAALRGELGWGPEGSDPTTAGGWSWFAVAPTAGYGPSSPSYKENYDQYEYTGTTPGRAQYAWSARFTVDDGSTWTYCAPSTMTVRQTISCSADGECFTDEHCIGGVCQVFCATADDCATWGPHCSGLGSGLNGLELFCHDGNASGGAVGDTCASDAACEQDLCLVGLSDTCTHGCGTSDAECSATAGEVCTEFSSLGLCAPSCAATDQCDTGKVCMSNVNDGQNRYDSLCLITTGTDDIGADCTAANNCATGACLTELGGAGVDLCTGFCVDAADCNTTLPTCSPVALTRPSGLGTQTVNLCTQ